MDAEKIKRWHASDVFAGNSKSESQFCLYENWVWDLGFFCGPGNKCPDELAKEVRDDIINTLRNLFCDENSQFEQVVPEEIMNAHLAGWTPQDDATNCPWAFTFTCYDPHGKLTAIVFDQECLWDDVTVVQKDSPYENPAR